MTTKTYDWKEVVGRLNDLLRLKTTPIGMKMYGKKEEMEAIPRIRRPQNVHTADQIVSQASRLNWTVGITNEDLALPQCGVVLGLHPRNEEWLKGEAMEGVWYETLKDSALHQHALSVNKYGQHEAMAVSPLVSGRIEDPDICLIYGTPGQMIIFINGLQYRNYKKLEWSVVGETSCADSWGRALSTGEPSLSLPCYAERRFGGVLDEEMLMALKPADLLIAIEGMEQLSKNGLRYPIAPLSIQADPTPSFPPSYLNK